MHQVTTEDVSCEVRGGGKGPHPDWKKRQANSQHATAGSQFFIAWKPLNVHSELRLAELKMSYFHAFHAKFSQLVPNSLVIGKERNPSISLMNEKHFKNDLLYIL